MGMVCWNWEMLREWGWGPRPVALFSAGGATPSDFDIATSEIGRLGLEAYARTCLLGDLHLRPRDDPHVRPRVGSYAMARGPSYEKKTLP
jgi:hypothetical protein